MADRSGRKWGHDTVNKMQGLADEIRDKKNPRKAVDPIAWVVNTCGLSHESVRRLARGRTAQNKKPHGNAIELHEDFAAAFADLCEACSRTYVKVIEDVATDTDLAASDRIKAAKWCVEATNPLRHSPDKLQVEVTQETAEPQASDTPQEVWDEMTEQEDKVLSVILGDIKALEKRRDDYIASIARRASYSDE